MAPHGANEVQKVKQPIVQGNVIGILVGQLLAAFCRSYRSDGRPISGERTRHFVPSDLHQNYLPFKPGSCNYLGKMCRYIYSTVQSVHMQRFVTDRG